MDPRVTRRSARLAEQRPSYPQSQPFNLPRSAPSSAFNSSSSLSSISSINTNVSASTSPMPDQTSQFSQAQYQQRFGNSAPLPSPSQSQQMHYFPSLQPQPQQMQQPTPQQHAYLGQRGGQMGGAPETAPFLSNLNLVAEAAKRAQMACLMRDFGECEL